MTWKRKKPLPTKTCVFKSTPWRTQMPKGMRTYHGVLAHQDNTLVAEGVSDFVHLLRADIVDGNDEDGAVLFEQALELVEVAGLVCSLAPHIFLFNEGRIFQGKGYMIVVVLEVGKFGGAKQAVVPRRRATIRSTGGVFHSSPPRQNCVVRSRAEKIHLLRLAAL